MIRVIDSKKVELTDDEWAMYQAICQAYTTPTNKGEDLFTELFETDNNGIIIFLKPPHTRQTSFEVFLFLMSVMQNQHLRLMHEKVNHLCAIVKQKYNI